VIAHAVVPIKATHVDPVRRYKPAAVTAPRSSAITGSVCWLLLAVLLAGFLIGFSCHARHSDSLDAD
jgi:hypothetical protein